MADKSKKLTSQQEDEFIKWINSKAKNHQCPVCQENSWEVGDHVIHVLAQQPLVEGVFYPQLFLTCKNCAFVRYFMAYATGVIKKEDETPKSEEDSDG